MPESRKPPLGKLGLRYARLFTHGSRGVDEAFWAELFLLWVSTPKLQAHLATMTPEDLPRHRETLNELSRRCIRTASDSEGIKAVSALQTLSCLIRSVSPAAVAGGHSPTLILFGDEETAGTQLPLLIGRLAELISGQDVEPTLQLLAMRTLLSFAVATPSLGENELLEALLRESVFEALVAVLASPAKRAELGREALVTLSLLAHYRRADNPYLVSLSILDNEMALNGYSQVICAGFAGWNSGFTAELGAAEAQGGVFSGLSNLLGALLVPEAPALAAAPSDGGLLLALYEALHLNRNFFACLTAPVEEASSNLLVAFLTYASVRLQELGSESGRRSGKLCMVALTCMAEDDYACSLMHDPNMAFRVPLYRPPRRHRKGALDAAPPLRPLAATLLDLNREFLQSHMMRALPVDLYMWSLGVIHRLLCFQRRARVRLDTQWRELWNALAGLLKFVTAHESEFASRTEVFGLAHKVLRVLNLFITFGDTFLPSPAHYDHLYYEIIRQHDVFDNLYAMVLRCLEEAGGGETSEAASRVLNQLANVRSIVAHFQPRLTARGAEAPLTQEEVLELVRGNYESLTLKLYENLDVFQRYDEAPQEAPFFDTVVSSVIREWRGLLDQSQLDHAAVLRQLSTIK